jgi:hypothetical protein
VAQIDIAKAPAAPDYVRFTEGVGPRFVVTIDTEEEFDWDAPLRRESHGVASVPALRTFQEFCESFGVAPIYVVDHPVATAPATVAALGEAVTAGRAEVGVHLHPWVSPPHDEDINETNSFAGNLPEKLEHAKFSGLHAAITANFATRPLIYRAGRYGVGPNSAAMLGEHGVVIDTSVRALFDYSQGGGPDFSRHPVRPYWLDRAGGLMEVPLTAVFWGPLRQLGRAFYPSLQRIPRLSGALARLGLLERIPLTPEGVTADEALRGIDVALDDGLPLLVFSFHSPSLAPGHTPYVRSEADLARFYDWWRAVFAHLAKRQVAPSSVRDILASVALA